MKAWWAQTLAEVTMTLRRGETLLLTVGIPVILLIFFSSVHVTSSPTVHRVDFVTPGILALSVMSTSLVALSIATGFERSYGVLRRLHVTPLGRRRLVAAKMAGVGVTEIVQVLIVVGVGLALGWHPHGGARTALEATAVLALASAGFAGIGLALAGRLRAEVNLAAANGLYLILLLFSGLVIPATSLPAPVQRVATALPSGALAEGLHRLFGRGVAPTGGDWICLAAWALAAPLVAARTFSFD